MNGVTGLLWIMQDVYPITVQVGYQFVPRCVRAACSPATSTTILYHRIIIMGAY